MIAALNHIPEYATFAHKMLLSYIFGQRPRPHTLRKGREDHTLSSMLISVRIHTIYN